MPEVVEEAPPVENDFQSASPGGPCDICVSCGACNPENMSELTVDSSTTTSSMGEFVTSNMAIWKAMPSGNIHNVEVGGRLVSGFKTADGELRLNTTDKYSPDIVTRKGTDYLNPETAPAPKTFDLTNAQINPEMQAHFREQLRLRKSSLKPETKNEHKPAQSTQSEQPKPSVTAGSKAHTQKKSEQQVTHNTPHDIGAKEKPSVVKQPQSESKGDISHIENTDALLGWSDNKSEKTTITSVPDRQINQLDQRSIPKHHSQSAEAKTAQTSDLEVSTPAPDNTKNESSVDIRTDTSPTTGETLSNNPDITAISVEPKPIEGTLDIKLEIAQSLNQKEHLDAEHIPSDFDTPEDTSPLPHITEQSSHPVIIEKAKPELTQLVQTHTEAIRALFDFMTILTEIENTTSVEVNPPSEKNNGENAEVTQPESETLQTIEFPDHSASVVKQFLIGAEAQRTDISGVMEIAKDTTTHESNSIHEEVFVIENEGQAWTIRLIEEKDKPVKIIAPRAAIRILKERLQKYLKQAGSEVDVMELVSEEENQNNYVSLSLGYADDAALFWLCYLQLKISFPLNVSEHQQVYIEA